MPRQQSAPSLRRKKHGGGFIKINNNNLVIMLMIIGGIVIFTGMALLYEFTKSVHENSHNSIRAAAVLAAGATTSTRTTTTTIQQQPPLVKKKNIMADHGYDETPKIEEEEEGDSYYSEKQKELEKQQDAEMNNDDADKLDESDDDLTLPEEEIHNNNNMNDDDETAKEVDDPEIIDLNRQADNNNKNKNNNNNNSDMDDSIQELTAQGGLPVLPIFAPVPNGKVLMQSTMDGTNPSLPGIVALLQTFLVALDTANKELRDDGDRNFDAQDVAQTFFDVSFQYLKPFDDAFRGRSIFPIRDDDSIFLSLAAYREHLLADTMKYAFTQSKNPDQLYVGAVVQNCFGAVREEDGTIDPSGKPCKTGVEVIGKDENGNPITKISDAGPDPNGIADFCNDSRFTKYCERGQVRVLYVHASESLGPAMARYYASKLWGGETYFMQCDSHLQFASHWDEKYVTEIKATSNFPKSVLSSYPPGFTTDTDPDFKGVRESNGARLCNCETIADEPNSIVRIGTGSNYRGDEARPTQIPFIAAGFFLAHADFLTDVPFDPYLPWCFMGEEIALSMRAWTHGWNTYAPRKDLIAHQYRPGRLGLPKFWESVDRFWGRPGIIHRVQAKVLKRIKHMVGYPDASSQKIQEEGIEVVLTESDEYGIHTTEEQQGKGRSWDDFLEFAHMEIDYEQSRVICNPNEWCNKGLKD